LSSIRDTLALFLFRYSLLDATEMESQIYSRSRQTFSQGTGQGSRGKVQGWGEWCQDIGKDLLKLLDEE
jgi:hypothetical protein